MAYTIKHIITLINSRLAEMVPGAQVFGVARTAARDGVFTPFIDGRYIGYDDKVLFRAYHKEQALSSADVPGSQYGDQAPDALNTHSNSLIIYWNEARLKMLPDQLYMNVQTRLNGLFKADGIKRGRISVTGAVLNDAQILAQEYGGGRIALKAESRIIQVNYSITVVFNKNCIPACLREC